MWIRITDISVRQVDAAHLNDPGSPGSTMVLNLFQRESRTALFVNTTKKVYPQYLDVPSGKVISKRRWTDQMSAFAKEEQEKLPLQKGGFRLTVFGWIFFLGAFALLGYLVYDGTVAAPQRTEQFDQRQAEKATVSEGDIYLGRIEVYKEKGNPLGMDGEFGCFKVVNVEGDTHHITKSTEMSKTAKPIAQMNSTDFAEEAIVVKAKELGAYHKTFVSDDGLTEISFGEKKE
ncbi:hypothetical protein [Parapedobacter sp. 10938]|uniref:hypothetical protein n=1 Tax=Parapedobacter flavus TaxID=3110225 RepID=UPI002DBFA0C0|nr:hypothetical protein [Parapedobacter sp. 10938]MEC3879222.1 hypothetical protein [Parapedobacter sp. 10938]